MCVVIKNQTFLYKKKISFVDVSYIINHPLALNLFVNPSSFI